MITSYAVNSYLSKIIFSIYEWCTWQICATVLTIYTAYQCLTFRSTFKDLEDTGYDQFYKTTKCQQDRKTVVANLRRSRTLGNLPPAYPNEWYGLLDTDEVRTGQVKHVSALGEHFVVFRGENEVIRILDAFCPHLGANLAVGGEVSGNCIQCPFHGWKFDGANGKCVSIPYSQNVPTEASLKYWKSCEVNTFIYVWYHAENEEPTWYPEGVTMANTWKYHRRSEYFIDTHIQDFVENAIDPAHFNCLHGPISTQKIWTKFASLQHESSMSLRTEAQQKHILDTYIRTKFNLLDCVTLENNSYGFYEGPGITRYRIETNFGCILILMTFTAVEPTLIKVVCKGFYPFSSILTGPSIFTALMGMIERDIFVWNHKKYENRPLLTKEEESIKKFRRWYTQFYTKNSPKFRKNTLDW